MSTATIDAPKADELSAASAPGLGIGTIVERPAGQVQEAENANSHRGPDRRRTERARHKFVTQMTPWSPGHPSIPFEVILEDISETGIGLIHSSPLELRLRHLLTVPRGPDEKPMVREYRVTRCDRRGDGNYSIGLELADQTTAAEPLPRKRITSERTKILFLIFGIVGLLVATFCPL